MKTIHKQVLQWNGTDEIEVEMPQHACHIDVQMQESLGGISQMTLWYICDPTQPLEKQYYRIVGTGWALSDDFMQNHYWLKTIQHKEHVWHVFYRTPKEYMEITS